MPGETVPPKTLLQSAGQKLSEQPKVTKALAAPASDSALAAASELLFVIVPFVVIAMTLAHKDQLKTIFFLPEWSIVSAVIVGQTIVKFVSATSGIHGIRERVVFTVSALLVLLLVPTLVLLSIVLTTEKVSAVLATTQCVLFFVSIIIFFFGSFLKEIFERE